MQIFFIQEHNKFCVGTNHLDTGKERFEITNAGPVSRGINKFRDNDIRTNLFDQYQCLARGNRFDYIKSCLLIKVGEIGITSQLYD